MNQSTVVGVRSVRPIWRMVIVTAATPKAAASASAEPDRGQIAAARPHHDQHADEAQGHRAPAMAADRLAEDQRRQHHREERRDEADRRRFGERQQVSALNAEHHRRQGRSRRAPDARAAARSARRRNCRSGDPGEQRRQPEGEAVESELGQADPASCAELDHRRHEGEAGRRADAQADAEQAVLLARAGASSARLKHKLSRRRSLRYTAAEHARLRESGPFPANRATSDSLAGLGGGGADRGRARLGPVPRPARAAAGRERADPLRPCPRRLARHGGLDRDRASPA